MGRLPLLLCAVGVLASASSAPAQTSFPIASTEMACPASPAPSGRDTSARESAGAPQAVRAPAGAPAIILRASASAREVRFASQPRIEVRLCGGVLDSVRVLERRNLPDPVQPGVTYRDVYIAVEIMGHLNAECIASRITGSSPAQGNPCVGIQLRDTTGAARRSGPP